MRLPPSHLYHLALHWLSPSQRYLVSWFQTSLSSWIPFHGAGYQMTIQSHWMIYEGIDPPLGVLTHPPSLLPRFPVVGDVCARLPFRLSLLSLHLSARYLVLLPLSSAVLWFLSLLKLNPLVFLSASRPIFPLRRGAIHLHLTAHRHTIIHLVLGRTAAGPLVVQGRVPVRARLGTLPSALRRLLLPDDLAGPRRGRRLV